MNFSFYLILNYFSIKNFLKPLRTNKLNKIIFLIDKLKMFKLNSKKNTLV